ncbi:hypothetical protein [Oryzihumus sp.]
MLVGVIVACEVLFWLALVAGLAARYLAGRRRLGAVLLAGAPLVDLILLTASVVDLRRGAAPSIAHALAGVYVGVSVGFGHDLVRWADARFVHRFAGAPRPPARPTHGRTHAAHERAGWYRHAVAWATGSILLGLASLLVGTEQGNEVFLGTAGAWGLVLAVDAVISFSYTLFPKRAGTRSPLG